MDVVKMKPGKIALGPASLCLSYSALVPPELRGNCLEITELLTEQHERGNNHANSLMQEVCEQADQAHISLLLLPEQYGAGGLSTDQLEAWYCRRHGFVCIQTEPTTILLRLPASAAIKWAGQ